MKKADWVKEQKFIDNYLQTGNATQSCIKAGYKEKNSAQMGYYLKTKLSKEIADRQRVELNAMSGYSIRVLEELLQNESASVRFQSAKLILELSGYREQHLRITHEKELNDRLGFDFNTGMAVMNKPDSECTDDELWGRLSDTLNDFPEETKEKIVKELGKKKTN
tara:strand:- start:231 stop:725 length:495 start_codon:yes stop_codon:yes gene_type:complete